MRNESMQHGQDEPKLVISKHCLVYFDLCKVGVRSEENEWFGRDEGGGRTPPRGVCQ